MRENLYFCSHCRTTVPVNYTVIGDREYIDCSACGNRMGYRNLNPVEKNEIDDVEKRLEKLEETVSKVGVAVNSLKAFAELVQAAQTGPMPSNCIRCNKLVVDLTNFCQCKKGE